MRSPQTQVGAGATALFSLIFGTACAFAQTTPTLGCQGSPSQPPGTVVHAPAIPQPARPDDIVGLIVQNTGASASERRFATFGQVFVPGQVKPQETLVVHTPGIAATAPVQMDALSLWPDRSVKFAALTFAVPRLCANAGLAFTLAKANPPAKPAAPVNLAARPLTLNVTLDFSAGSYRGRHSVDIGKALQASLARQPDYWLRGPLVAQARVDVPLGDGQFATTSTLHLTADVSLFADGSAMADVQFNNDLATVIPGTGKTNPQPPLPALDYTATIDFQGRQASHRVSQVQYTAWHHKLWTLGPPSLNIQHDIAYLIKTGAVLPYELGNGVDHGLLQSYEKSLAKPDFGQPLAANGITPYMPMSGGRPDIGFTTQFNTVWLLTQDARAAAIAIGQSDTSGAIPWNFKLANGRWLTPDEVTDIWTDERGGPNKYSSGIANAASTQTWTPDTAHQPNLNYIPYLMTASRWHLDRLFAQAAFNLSYTWPGERCKTNQCNTLANGMSQVRSQAWSLREVIQAAFVATEGSAEQRYFNKTVADNWAFLKSRQSILANQQGEAAGWLPPSGGALWQQDFFTVVAAMAALMGDRDARQFVAWQTPWLSGRFVGPGMNPHDGCAYNIKLAENGQTLTTWAAIASATQAAGLSNGNGWKTSGGYYCALARSALSTALMLAPQRAELAAALAWLDKANAPFTNQASFRADPTFGLRLPAPEQVGAGRTAH